MTSFRIVNYEKLQHYKKRNPPWIKLYKKLLKNKRFQALDEATQIHLVKIWILASMFDNSLPFFPEWVGQQIGAKSPVNLKAMLAAGFIENASKDDGEIR